MAACQLSCLYTCDLDGNETKAMSDTLQDMCHSSVVIQPVINAERHMHASTVIRHCSSSVVQHECTVWSRGVVRSEASSCQFHVLGDRSGSIRPPETCRVASTARPA
jgi:hypothetical protein